jgi:hypothetical protein
MMTFMGNGKSRLVNCYVGMNVGTLTQIHTRENLNSGDIGENSDVSLLA